MSGRVPRNLETCNVVNEVWTCNLDDQDQSE